MPVADLLVDTSALTRVVRAEVREVVQPLLERGRLALCGTVGLELLHSSRSSDDHARLSEYLTLFEWVETDDSDFRTALEVQAQRGQLRSVGVADLVIAAVATRHRLTVVHYDQDFDVVAEVTRQPTQWVVPRGSVD